MNVSSYGFVVTLHGVVEDEDGRREIEVVVWAVEGVEGVVDKLRCNEGRFRS